MQLLQRLGVGAGDVVVDLGCGTGWLTIEAARLGAATHGVDVSAAMIDYARATAAEAAVQAAFHHAGFLTYQHAGAAATFVLTRYALHHLPDHWKVIALQRMADMLAPEGTLYLKDVVFSFAPVEYERRFEHWIDDLSRRSGWSRDDLTEHIRDEFSTFSWLLEAMLERVGLAVVERTTGPNPMYAEFVCSKRRYASTMFQQMPAGSVR